MPGSINPGNDVISNTPRNLDRGLARRLSGGRNLLLYSEEADQADWLVQDCTVDTDVAVAPDGTTTMDRINVDLTTADHAITQGITVLPGGIYTFAADILDDGAGFGGVSVAEASEDFFSVLANLSTGAIVATDVGAGGGEIFGSGIIDRGAGIYRVWVAGRTTAAGLGTLFCYVYASDSASPTFGVVGTAEYLGVAGEDIIAWGMQVNPGSSPEPYTKTTGVAIP